jgi:uncharacterized caspase-like protein
MRRPITIVILVFWAVSSFYAQERGIGVVNGSEQRVALVIGNSLYHDSPLRNPINDAQDMASALRSFGFEVIERENVSKREMEEQIRAFGKRLRRGAIGLFYFSGHGVQLNGRNYLIPIGYNIDKEQDVEFEAVEVGRVLGEMEAAQNRMNIVRMMSNGSAVSFG